MTDDESEYVSEAARHAQLMRELDSFCRRLILEIVGAIIIVCGFVIFFFWRP